MRSRPKKFWLLLALLAATPLMAHDMFWRLSSYYVAPSTKIALPMLNGTFSKSENSIEWARVADLSVAEPGVRRVADSVSWRTDGDTSRLMYTTGATGTYVVGLSTKSRDLSLDAKSFNTYLADDGIPDVLAARKRDGLLQQPARERYSKHVKAIFQVGQNRTDGWETNFGYPAELVPLANPYTTKVGTTLQFRCLVDGKPVANQLVMVGGRRGPSGDQRLPARSLRSDRDGMVSVPVTAAGRWYVKFIHMQRTSDTSVDYESKWATITFEVR